MRFEIAYWKLFEISSLFGATASKTAVNVVQATASFVLPKSMLWNPKFITVQFKLNVVHQKVNVVQLKINVVQLKVNVVQQKVNVVKPKVNWCEQKLEVLYHMVNWIFTYIVWELHNTPNWCMISNLEVCSFWLEIYLQWSVDSNYLCLFQHHKPLVQGMLAHCNAW